MLELAQQLSYYLSVVDGGATGKLVGFGQELAAVGMMAMTAKASLQQIIAPVQAVAAAWGQREQQINNIAASLRQYQYVGQSIVDINRDIAASMPGATGAERDARFATVYANQFRDARALARAQLQDLNRLAAILPGEANDYMEALALNQGSFGQAGVSLQETNRLVANLVGGGIGHGLNSGMVGRDLMQFLTVGPHMVDSSWNLVWKPLVAGFKLHGRAVTQASIGQMNLTDKMAVLRHIVDGLGPQMGAMGDSYEATMGTFRSLQHELYLGSTEAIFDEWKALVTEVNIVLTKFGPQIAIVGKFFGDKLATGIHMVTDKLKDMEHSLGRIPQVIYGPLGMRANAAYQTAMRYGSAAYHGVSGVAGRLYGGVRGTMDAHGLSAGHLAMGALPFIITRAFSLALGPVGMVLMSLFTRLFAGGSGGSTLAALGAAVTMLLPPLFELAVMLYRAYDAVMNVAVAFLATLLPPLVMIATAVLVPLIDVFSWLIGLVLNFGLGALFPVVLVLGLALPVFSMIFQVAAAGWRMLAGLFDLMLPRGFDLIDAFRQLGDFLQEYTNSMQRWLNDKMHDWGMMTDEEYAIANAQLRATEAGEAGSPKWLIDLRASLEQLAGNTANMNRKGRDTNPQRPHTTQDFRYSRFDITQKFAEGFSPDRVASAFVTDLEALADQRLQSGMVPAGSLT